MYVICRYIWTHLKNMLKKFRNLTLSCTIQIVFMNGNKSIKFFQLINILVNIYENITEIILQNHLSVDRFIWKQELINLLDLWNVYYCSFIFLYSVIDWKCSEKCFKILSPLNTVMIIWNFHTILNWAKYNCDINFKWFEPFSGYNLYILNFEITENL